MKSLFQHTYADGTKVSLKVETINGALTFMATPSAVEPKHEAEYQRWREEVVVPDLMAQLDPAHKAALAAVGLAKLKKEKA